MSAPTPDTPQVLLEHHLKALRLPTMLREYDKLARSCACAATHPARRHSRGCTRCLPPRERSMPRFVPPCEGAKMTQAV